MHVDLGVLLDSLQPLVKSEGPNAKHESPRRLAWPPPQLISVFWKSRFGPGRPGTMLHQVQSNVDSKETSVRVRSGCVWVCASVPLWACWWHHKPLNQCFTAPRQSGVFFFYFNKKYCRQRLKGFFLLRSELHNMARQPHSVMTAL